MIQKIKGTKDLFDKEILEWRYIERIAKELFINYGYTEIQTPVFENTQLYNRGIGDTTDIVGKEMYTFIPDKSDESITLRPEMTAGVMRAVIENHLYHEHSTKKFYYISELFRKERPQAGRQRQFWQIGIELIGSRNPSSDAETIILLYKLSDKLNIKNKTLLINSIGTSEERNIFKIRLKEYYEKFSKEFNESSKERLTKNPLRLLDSKDPFFIEINSSAPEISNFLGNESKRFFENVQSYLVEAGIPFEVNTKLVRGLDYYSHTAYELISGNLGSQNAIGGGGRYDLLSSLIGSDKEIPAVGFAAGMERLMICRKNESVIYETENRTKVYVAFQDEKYFLRAYSIANQLRDMNVITYIDLNNRSLKAQFKEADRLNCEKVLIIGEDEINRNEVQIKNLKSGEIKYVNFSNLTNVSSFI